MSNKKKLSLFLILALVLSLSLGTFAYYSKTFTSDNNKVRAAKFEVDSNGTLNGDAEFDLTGDPIYPGIKDEIYEFEIDKKNTEVPVKYTITITPYDELFAPVSQGNSPVEVKLLRKVGDKWERLAGLENVEIVPENTVEKFRIDMEWEHSDYDIEYQGKPGKVKINVIATQTDGKVNPNPDPEDPEDPENPENPDEPQLVEAIFLENNFIKNFGYVKLQVKNLEGAAKYRIQYFLNDKEKGRVPYWTEIITPNEYDKHLIYYLPGDALTIEYYAEDGTTLLHTFEKVVLTRQ
jgi:hypothetical protein